MADNIRTQIARWLAPQAFATPITVRVDDAPGWQRLGTVLDRDWAELYQMQTDALLAWRTNPLAKGIVNLQTNFVVADGITLSSRYKDLNRFIEHFWQHPENRMALRLPDLCDELTRAGELFPVLHVDPAGMSIFRCVPAQSIDRLEWQAGDYEHETRYHEVTDNLDGRWWPAAADNPDAPAVMLHYAVNKAVGCTRGESDLASVMTWLRRYSGWLEDRARLNWAARVFLWLVTVPTNQIEAKKTQYAGAPDPGSVIVKDSAETWEMQTPNLQGRDAASDGRQLRYMVAAGSGVPLHMLGEGENTNLATAQAMQIPTMRQYRRRQLYFGYMLADLTACAYNRWAAVNGARRRKVTYADILVQAPELDLSDNGVLATAGRDVVQMLAGLRAELAAAGIGPSDELTRRTVEMAFRFAGDVLTEAEILAVLSGPAIKPPVADDGRPTTDDGGARAG